MSVAQNQTIVKNEVINLFNTNIKNVIGASLYHSGNHMKYSTPASTEALPTDQYGGNLDAFTISDTQITASTIYNTLVNLVKNYTRVRNTTSVSYLLTESRTNGSVTSSSDNVQQTLTGKVAYGVTVPSVSGSTRPYYVKSPNDTAMTKNISPANPGITQNTTILASHITTFFNNLKSAWDSIYNNNAIRFEYHYCHSNWDSWASRARR